MSKQKIPVPGTAALPAGFASNPATPNTWSSTGQFNIGGAPGTTPTQQPANPSLPMSMMPNANSPLVSNMNPMQRQGLLGMFGQGAPQPPGGAQPQPGQPQGQPNISSLLQQMGQGMQTPQAQGQSNPQMLGQMMQSPQFQQIIQQMRQRMMNGQQQPPMATP